MVSCDWLVSAYKLGELQTSKKGGVTWKFHMTEKPFKGTKQPGNFAIFGPINFSCLTWTLDTVSMSYQTQWKSKKAAISQEMACFITSKIKLLLKLDFWDDYYMQNLWIYTFPFHFDHKKQKLNKLYIALQTFLEVMWAKYSMKTSILNKSIIFINNYPKKNLAGSHKWNFLVLHNGLLQKPPK